MLRVREVILSRCPNLRLSDRLRGGSNFEFYQKQSLDFFNENCSQNPFFDWPRGTDCCWKLCQDELRKVSLLALNGRKTMRYPQ